jgi:hypothetical protein
VIAKADFDGASENGVSSGLATPSFGKARLTASLPVAPAYQKLSAVEPRNFRWAIRCSFRQFAGDLLRSLTVMDRCPRRYVV